MLRAEEADHELADIATPTLIFNHRSIHTDSLTPCKRRMHVDH
jgi:hypothetical protein